MDTGLTIGKDAISGPSSTLGEVGMSARIATTFAIVVAAAMAGTAANAACTVKGPYGCADTGSAVNLNSVPDIANKIVSEEPTGAKQGKSAAEPTAPGSYTGPTVGVTSGKRSPTVGYSWSLE
jgi:hypothetical protein